MTDMQNIIDSFHKNVEYRDKNIWYLFIVNGAVLSFLATHINNGILLICSSIFAIICNNTLRKIISRYQDIISKLRHDLPDELQYNTGESFAGIIKKPIKYMNIFYILALIWGLKWLIMAIFGTFFAAPVLFYHFFHF